MPSAAFINSYRHGTGVVACNYSSTGVRNTFLLSDSVTIGQLFVHPRFVFGLVHD